MKIPLTIFTAVVAFAQFAGAIAAAQQVPDPRVADLVQAGKIRVGVHSVMYTKDPQTGEAKAASVGIILHDIARAIAARIGVEIVLVGHPTIPEMLTCLTTGACDMAFMGPDPSRTGVDFSPPPFSNWTTPFWCRRGLRFSALRTSTGRAFASRP